MAALFRNPFKKKSAEVRTEVVEPCEVGSGLTAIPHGELSPYIGVIADIARHLALNPTMVSATNLELFLSYAEVFFPINFIASRIASAHFEIKKVSDDSIVWCTGRTYKAQRLAKILSKPNCLQTFSQFVYMHFVNYLADGNGFIRAAMPSSYKSDTEKWRWCDNFWAIPSPLITVQTPTVSTPIYGVCKVEDIIQGYQLGAGVNTQLIPTWQIWHDRDNYPNIGMASGNFLKSASRLDAMRKTISTLKAVYDARNIIYNRCGAIGILTNKSRDDAGPVAMDENEKKELIKKFNSDYGVTGDKSPIAITDADLAYFRIGMSISELQPFEETLNDAITIAGQFGIPSCLVPRKDMSTFDNQKAAEKGVYSGVIIPMAKRFCQEFTEFLGIEEAGFYIDCNFDDVDCLQAGRKESEEVRKMVNERCRQQFIDGLITINDWRGQIHESALDGEVYAKTRFEMTDEELAFIERVIKTNSINNNPQQIDGKDNEESADADENK